MIPLESLKGDFNCGELVQFWTGIKRDTGNSFFSHTHTRQYGEQISLSHTITSDAKNMVLMGNRF